MPCRNEQQFEEQLPHGYRKAWRSESVTYYGAAPSYAQLPPQQQWGGLAGAGLFAAAALVGVWAAVGAALRSNFHKTRCGGTPGSIKFHCLDCCTSLPQDWYRHAWRHICTAWIVGPCLHDHQHFRLPSRGLQRVLRGVYLGWRFACGMYHPQLKRWA